MTQDKRCHKAIMPKPDMEPELIDEDFFTELCNSEILYLCEKIGLSELNVFLIGLHVQGCADSKIAEAVDKYFPSLAEGKKLTQGAIKERRHYAIRQMKKVFGDRIGLITLMHQAFK
ncbi:MAG: hypothetical protein IK083_09960 [Abditibacteriota bacterium]|nr:hypothetical protein [Abditibacteriota bacterium]